MKNLTGKDWRNILTYGAVFGIAIGLLLTAIITWMPGFKLTFATAGAEFAKPTATGAGSGQLLGQWLIDRTRLPIGTGFFGNLILSAIAGILVFGAGYLLTAFTGNMGKTPFQKLFIVLGLGSFIVGWIYTWISTGVAWSGLAFGTILTLAIASAVYAGVMTGFPVLRQWTQKWAGL